MDSINPYAPPTVQDPASLPPRGCTTDGRYLYLTDGATLPERCAITNKPLDDGDRIYSRKFVYTPPWVYLLLFIHILVLILVAMIVRKRATASYWLSDEVRRQYNKRRWFALGVIGISAAGIFGATQLQDADTVTALVMLGFLFILLGLIGLILATPLKVKGHKNGTFRISGCCPEFLAALPSGGFPPKLGK